MSASHMTSPLDGPMHDTVCSVCGDPTAVLMFEGLAPSDLQRLLRREHVRDYVAEVLSPDDPDIATALTMVARCTWVWR